MSSCEVTRTRQITAVEQTGMGLKQIHASKRELIVHRLFERRALSRVARLERGKFSVRPRNDPRYYGGDIPFIQTGDVARARRMLTVWSQTVNELGLSVSKLFPRGTIFMSIAANVGDVAISAFDAACPDSVIGITPNAGVDAEWLFQALLHSKKALSSLATQNAQANLSLEKLSGFGLFFPPELEQQRIGTILRTWDEAVEKLDALIDKRKAEYDAYSRQFFAQCHRGCNTQSSDWMSFSLGELFKERVESGTESDALLSITMADGVIGQEEVGRRDSSCEDKSNYRLILTGDIGYNTMRMWQGVCGLSALRGIVSPAYTVVTPIAARINAHYAFHLFKSRRMIHDFRRYSQGLTSDTWNLKYPAFSEIKVFIPDLTIQAVQAKYLNTIKEEIGILKRQAEMLSNQKSGLMQKLLAGEWRVRA